jgi:hypothetical protein
MNCSQTLYQKVLGEEYQQLPKILQEFHARPQGGSAVGRIEVRHGEGVVRKMLARLLRLPREGKDIPLRLQVVVRDNQEEWVRYFGEQRLATLQWDQQGYLVEKGGPLKLLFQLTADPAGMTFNIQKNRVGIISVPTWLMMRVHARATATDCGWKLSVAVALPLFGVITAYSGTITPI